LYSSSFYSALNLCSLGILLIFSFEVLAANAHTEYLLFRQNHISISKFHDGIKHQLERYVCRFLPNSEGLETEHLFKFSTICQFYNTQVFLWERLVKQLELKLSILHYISWFHFYLKKVQLFFLIQLLLVSKYSIETVLKFGCFSRRQAQIDNWSLILQNVSNC
jgi:hypothetical protein